MPEALELAGVRWWLRAGQDPLPLAPSLARLPEQLAAAADLRSGRRKRLYRLALGTSGRPDHLLKRSADPGLRGWLRRRSKARRELAIAQRLEALGVAVVVPLAAGERRRGGRLIEGYLLAPLLEDATDLRRLWDDPALGAARRRRLAEALGRLVRRAHAAGLEQDDLAPNNVLVAGTDAELRLVDFERARLRRRVGLGARRQMLAKLARAAAALPATLRLRFLRAYAGDREEARRWWRRLCAEAPRLARRDDMRMRRTATRDGRRFERFARHGWCGWARRGADAAAALARLAPERGGGARIEAAPGMLGVSYPRLSRRAARGLWARANTLAARGLAPVPLALATNPARSVLLFSADAGARRLEAGAGDAAGRGAVVRLLAELGALGELGAALAASDLVLVPGAQRQRAQLVACHAFRFTGRAGGAGSRARAARLLAGLGPG